MKSFLAAKAGPTSLHLGTMSADGSERDLHVLSERDQRFISISLGFVEHVLLNLDKHRLKKSVSRAHSSYYFVYSPKPCQQAHQH